MEDPLAFSASPSAASSDVHLSSSKPGGVSAMLPDLSITSSTLAGSSLACTEVVPQSPSSASCVHWSGSGPGSGSEPAPAEPGSGGGSNESPPVGSTPMIVPV